MRREDVRREDVRREDVKPMGSMTYGEENREESPNTPVATSSKVKQNYCMV